MTVPRYGVISDVHGNLHALRRALDLLSAAGVDRLLCLGDAIGYGPYPQECVELIASFDPVAVSGNHELIALGKLSDAACTSAAKESLRWTRDRLSAVTAATIGGWPATATAPGVVLAHGSPQSAEEYVRSPARASALLDWMSGSHPTAQVLLLGHTHAAWAFSGRRGTVLSERPGSVRLDAGDRLLLNPGSVGQSRDRHAHARFAVLDLERAVADFYSVPYDVRASRAALRSLGLPAEWCHVVPPRAERLRSIVGDSLRRAGLRHGDPR